MKAIAKICLYSVSKINEELWYLSSKYSTNNLKSIINELLDQIKSKYDEIDEDSEDWIEVPNHEVSVLIIEETFDIRSIPFIHDPDDDNNLLSESEEAENLGEKIGERSISNFDYNVKQLVANYLEE